MLDYANFSGNPNGKTRLGAFTSSPELSGQRRSLASTWAVLGSLMRLRKTTNAINTLLAIARCDMHIHKDGKAVYGQAYPQKR